LSNIIGQFRLQDKKTKYLLFFLVCVIDKQKEERVLISAMEKRREKRLDEENKVVLHVLAEDGQEKQSFYSFSRDLSVGGLRIMTDSPLPVKTKLKIEIALSESKKVISGLAEVRWVKSLFEDEVYEMGLEFIDLDPQSKVFLLEHIYKRTIAR